MSCITPEDLFNYPTCCNYVEQICCSYEAIQEALNCNCDLIFNLIGRNYCPTAECKVFDGTGSCKLYLGEELQSLESVEVLKCDTCTLDCGCEEEELPCVSGNLLEYRCKGTFPCGTKNIKVCGTWGETLPGPVKKAIIWLTMEEICPGVLGLTSSNGVDSVQWSDFSIKYTSQEPSMFTTGYVKIDQLISQFVNPSDQLYMGATSDCSCYKIDCQKCNRY